LTSIYLYNSERLKPLESRLAVSQSDKDILEFARDLGFDLIEVEKITQLPKKLRSITSKTKIILTIYPGMFTPLKRKKILLKILQLYFNLIFCSFLKRKTSIFYVTDLPIDQSIAANATEIVNNTSYRLEKRLFKAVDKICVFNENVVNVVSERYKLPREKFVTFEILDYGIKIEHKNNNENLVTTPIKIAQPVGYLQKKYMVHPISSLPQDENIVYDFFGPGGDWINDLNRLDINYFGVKTQKETIDYLTYNTHFGLLMRDLTNEKFNVYHNMTSTSKFGAFMVSGVPILVPAVYEYISSLVTKYQIGIVFKDVSEIPDLVKDCIKTGKYLQLKKNSLELGSKVSNGYFFKTAIKKALLEYQ